MTSTINFCFHQQRAFNRVKGWCLTRRQIKARAAMQAATYGLPQPQPAALWESWKIVGPARRAGLVGA